MELDALKSTWNNIENPVKTPEEIQQMLIENNHPVLKEIRKQLLIEVIGWSAFLMVYYTMFDGDQKPLLINILLVVSVAAALVHNLTGYRLSSHLVAGTSIRASLQHYLVKVRTYAVISVISRVLLMAGFLLFFTYNISFDTGKYLMLSGAIALFAFQLILLCRIWLRRLRRLSNTLAAFLQP